MTQKQEYAIPRIVYGPLGKAGFLPIVSIVVPFWGYLLGSVIEIWLNQKRSYNGDYRYHQACHPSQVKLCARMRNARQKPALVMLQAEHVQVRPVYLLVAFNRYFNLLGLISTYHNSKG